MTRAMKAQFKVRKWYIFGRFCSFAVLFQFLCGLSLGSSCDGAFSGFDEPWSQTRPYKPSRQMVRDYLDDIKRLPSRDVFAMLERTASGVRHSRYHLRQFMSVASKDDLKVLSLWGLLFESEAAGDNGKGFFNEALIIATPEEVMNFKDNNEPSDFATHLYDLARIVDDQEAFIGRAIDSFIGQFSNPDQVLLLRSFIELARLDASVRTAKANANNHQVQLQYRTPWQRVKGWIWRLRNPVSWKSPTEESIHEDWHDYWPYRSWRKTIYDIPREYRERGLDIDR